jgi:uncharacterized membrane protein
MIALIRMRSVLYWFLSLVMAVVAWRFLVLGVEASMEFVAYHAAERPLAYYAHVGFAPVALALAPFQFWAALRARRPGLHRWLGRAYGLSILVAGIGGLSMALGTEAGPMASAGFATLAVLWVGTTARGVQLAMAGRIAEHRRWMIRSAALTFAAVTLRIELPLLQAGGLGLDEAYGLVAWSCWVPNLTLAERFLGRAGLPARAG